MEQHFWAGGQRKDAPDKWYLRGILKRDVPGRKGGKRALYCRRANTGRHRVTTLLGSRKGGTLSFIHHVVSSGEITTLLQPAPNSTQEVRLLAHSAG